LTLKQAKLVGQLAKGGQSDQYRYASTKSVKLTGIGATAGAKAAIEAAGGSVA
jgi:large subunit ribosomal protein L15